MTTTFGADGCQITVEQRKAKSTYKDPEPDTDIQTWQIPLAAVRPDSISVKARRIVGGTDWELFYGPQIVYDLNVFTDNDAILEIWQSIGDLPVIRPPEKNLTGLAKFRFKDEALSQRIMTGFKYAVMYCRAKKASKPEPF